MEDVQRITKRRRRRRRLDEPHPWEPRHMKLHGFRYAETVGDPAGRRNVALGVIKHLWRSPVPFVGFYAPEGNPITEHRHYSPAQPRPVDDADYLAGIEAHKKAFAEDLTRSMVPSGLLPGYFEVPTEEGWNLDLDLVARRLELTDAWGMASSMPVLGDLAPFVWAYRRCGFCIVTLYDKDIDALRDDLLFVAKREGVDLHWRRRSAA